MALGNIVEETDESPVLIITDLAVGKYIFNLTVYDEQGLSDSDIITFIVKHDSKLFYLVELTIDVDANTLTEEQYDVLKGKLALLVKDGSKVKVRICFCNYFVYLIFYFPFLYYLRLIIVFFR